MVNGLLTKGVREGMRQIKKIEFISMRAQPVLGERLVRLTDVGPVEKGVANLSLT